VGAGVNVRQWLAQQPDYFDVLISLALLFVLASMPATSKFAVWAAAAILFLQIINRKAH